jgi:hypothetical protein
LVLTGRWLLTGGASDDPALFVKLEIGKGQSLGSLAHLFCLVIIVIRVLLHTFDITFGISRYRRYKFNTFIIAKC